MYPCLAIQSTPSITKYAPTNEVEKKTIGRAAKKVKMPVKSAIPAKKHGLPMY